MLSKITKLSLQGPHFLLLSRLRVSVTPFCGSRISGPRVGEAFAQKGLKKGPGGDTFEDYGFPKPKMFI